MEKESLMLLTFPLLAISRWVSYTHCREDSSKKMLMRVRDAKREQHQTSKQEERARNSRFLLQSKYWRRERGRQSIYLASTTGIFISSSFCPKEISLSLIIHLSKGMKEIWLNDWRMAWHGWHGRCVCEHYPLIDKRMMEDGRRGNFNYHIQELSTLHITIAITITF